MWRKLKDYVVIHVLSTHHDPLINTGMAEEIYDEEEEEACLARFVRFRLERVLYTYCRVRVQFT